LLLFVVLIVVEAMLSEGTNVQVSLMLASVVKALE